MIGQHRLRRLPHSINARADAAARCRNLFVSCACRALFKINQPRSHKHRMRMRIYKPRQHHLATAIQFNDLRTMLLQPRMPQSPRVSFPRRQSARRRSAPPRLQSRRSRASSFRDEAQRQRPERRPLPRSRRPPSSPVARCDAAAPPLHAARPRALAITYLPWESSRRSGSQTPSPRHTRRPRGAARPSPDRSSARAQFVSPSRPCHLPRSPGLACCE